ncbi:hypothetical protein BE20_28850 [Sorangium cellulosum]|nr:hypothetical protein BE20_28850 [Sorangium cellulosum]
MPGALSVCPGSTTRTFRRGSCTSTRRGPLRRTTHTSFVPATSRSSIFSVSSASSCPTSAYSMASSGTPFTQPGRSGTFPTATSGARRVPGPRA